MSYDYFTEEELACSCGCGMEMDSDFMIRLDRFRYYCGFPFIITSAARCEEYNRTIGGASRSKHVEGRAVDIAVRGKDALRIVTEASLFGFHGIGVSQKGQSRFIHIDDRPEDEKALWSY